MRVEAAAQAALPAIQGAAATMSGARMALLILIKYFLLLATRKRTVEVSLFVLTAVLLLSAGLLSINAEDVAVPPAELQFAQSQR
jgi:hypothetical protein